MSETQVPLGFFGKLPARGDFVRSGDDHALLSWLDQWAGQGLELLSRDVAWKQAYDQAPPLAFAVMGARSRNAIAGHWLSSQDASQRRFPFLAAARIDAQPPLDFLARSPMALSRLWAALSRMSREVTMAEDPSEPLRRLSESRPALNLAPGSYDAPFFDFLDMQSVGSLREMLQSAGHGAVELKWTLPALGLLLQPALSQAPGQIDKGLSLPLPRDPIHRSLAAAFWMDLMAGFFARADYQLALLLPDSEQPRLVLGLNGADGATLHSLLDPQVAREQLIRVDDAEWIEDQLSGDYALNKLASYLDHDDISLRSIRQVFRETFLGA
ncbi:type VI secretion system-associated protein TagF [Pseudoxanthomonas kalamensis DSM 18571]|uniref:type VI secretion system-associated protein TagF n=1 Tax=Pseudoxanthomonas kalamensis TaxID=289483 RepID=UPI0013920052|nr:type VI secretion system-associated protein TagF [Pseudoxanthomonas kalamensis]KAF1712520.1 type VI secretion system-associated protein TagF [Pseudoxanthomonas kalamensis DSM 18571]